MTRQRTFSVLLAVAIALLGLDLVLRLSPQEATGQELVWRAESELPVRVIQLTSTGGDGVFYRLWNDGAIERNYWAMNSNCAPAGFCGWEFVPDDVPPQQGARIIDIFGGEHALFRLWSNGVIELKEILSGTCGTLVWCGWQIVPDVPRD